MKTYDMKSEPNGTEPFAHMKMSMEKISNELGEGEKAKIIIDPQKFSSGNASIADLTDPSGLNLISAEVSEPDTAEIEVRKTQG